MLTTPTSLAVTGTLMDDDYRFALRRNRFGCGITERVDDITALMAAVAQSPRLRKSSCPIVEREFFLWPDEKRRLFGGIDKHVNPVSDKTVSFEITAEDLERLRKRSPSKWLWSQAPGLFGLRSPINTGENEDVGRESVAGPDGGAQKQRQDREEGGV